MRRNLGDRCALAEQQPRRARVLAETRGPGHIHVHRGAQQRMDEVKRRLGPEDRSAHQRFRRIERLVRRLLGERGRPLQRRAAPENRDRTGKLAGRGRKANNAQQHRARDAFGHELGHRFRPACLGRDPLRSQFHRQLAQEERVAPGNTVACAAELIRRVLAQRGADEPGSAAAAQRPGLYEPRLRNSGQRMQKIRIAGLCEWPGSEDEPERVILHPRREIGQKTEGRRIGPVDVVDRNEHRSLRRKVRDQPVETVHRSERISGGASRSRFIETEHVRRDSGGPGKPPIAFVQLAISCHAGQKLAGHRPG